MLPLEFGKMGFDSGGGSDNNYTDEDKAKVDKITTDGDGSKFLANDGTYKTAGGGSVGEYYVGPEGTSTNKAQFIAFINEYIKTGVQPTLWVESISWLPKVKYTDFDINIFKNQGINETNRHPAFAYYNYSFYSITLSIGQMTWNDDKTELLSVSYVSATHNNYGSILTDRNSKHVTKSMLDDAYKSYSGYDATKTQVLKNVNGTLTWVDE